MLFAYSRCALSIYTKGWASRHRSGSTRCSIAGAGRCLQMPATTIHRSAILLCCQRFRASLTTSSFAGMSFSDSTIGSIALTPGATNRCNIKDISKPIPIACRRRTLFPTPGECCSAANSSKDSLSGRASDFFVGLFDGKGTPKQTWNRWS